MNIMSRAFQRDQLLTNTRILKILINKSNYEYKPENWKVKNIFYIDDQMTFIRYYNKHTGLITIVMVLLDYIKMEFGLVKLSYDNELSFKPITKMSNNI